MFLQYYLNDQGDRVYTLKVRKENRLETVMARNMGGGAVETSHRIA